MRNQYILKRIIYLLIICVIVFCITTHGSAAVKIVAFGDSITAGSPYLRVGDGCRCPLEGYEVQLEEQMDTAGFTIEVYNYGISGETTTRGVNRIESVLIAQKPDYVLLLEGTNDLNTINNGNPSTVRDNLSSMIEMVLNEGAIPILATLTPDTRDPDGLSKDISQTNILIKNLWEQKVEDGKNVLYTDLYAAVVTDWDKLSDDQIHPNKEGYGVIAKAWANTLLLKLDLNTSGNGQGSVSYNPPDGDCTTCILTFFTGTEVTLQAKSAKGYVFTGWLGECTAQGQNPVCVLTVDKKMSVTATFGKKFNWSLFLPAIMSIKE